MKKFKNIIWIAILVVALLPVTLVKANAGEFVRAGTVESLNNQLYIELKDVLSEPVSLIFQDKDIKGVAFAFMKVNKDGKIELAGVSSENENLLKVVTKKIESKNLWTDKKYANNVFRYKIEMI